MRANIIADYLNNTETVISLEDNESFANDKKVMKLALNPIPFTNDANTLTAYDWTGSPLDIITIPYNANPAYTNTVISYECISVGDNEYDYIVKTTEDHDILGKGFNIYYIQSISPSSCITTLYYAIGVDVNVNFDKFDNKTYILFNDEKISEIEYSDTEVIGINRIYPIKINWINLPDLTNWFSLGANHYNSIQQEADYRFYWYYSYDDESQRKETTFLYKIYDWKWTSIKEGEITVPFTMPSEYDAGSFSTNFKTCCIVNDSLYIGFEYEYEVDGEEIGHDGIIKLDTETNIVEILRDREIPETPSYYSKSAYYCKLLTSGYIGYFNTSEGGILQI